VLVPGVDQYAPLPATLDALREIDLAGNPVRETNIDAVNAQLTAQGFNPIFTFTHDVERLPNGATAVICPTERTIDVNGTPTDYVGMTIVVLDEDFQVAWAWDAFDHLDVNRGPILGEILREGGADQLTASTPRPVARILGLIGRLLPEIAPPAGRGDLPLTRTGRRS
jgi:hypothetical protein